MIRVLDHYLADEMSAEDVELWASAVEGRDDVGLEGGFQAMLKEIVFELANPYLTLRLNSLVAEDLKRRLKTA